MGVNPVSSPKKLMGGIQQRRHVKNVPRAVCAGALRGYLEEKGGRRRSSLSA